MSAIIDVHAHAWPDAVAAKALAHSIPDLEQFGDGRIASLEASMATAGVDRSVVLAVANTPAQVEKANRFVGGLDRGKFIGFGSVHAGLSPEENVESLRRNGLVGTKIHPLFQGYGLDDPRLAETLAALEGEFIVIVHVGAGGSADANAGCTPRMLADVVERHPRLDVIACHFGGYRLLEEAAEIVIGLPVYVDTSWPPSVGEIGAEKVAELIERHGHERVLFGSDWPMASPAREVEAIRGLGLGPERTAAVLGGNMERLLAKHRRGEV